MLGPCSHLWHVQIQQLRGASAYLPKSSHLKIEEANDIILNRIFEINFHKKEDFPEGLQNFRKQKPIKTWLFTLMFIDMMNVEK